MLMLIAQLSPCKVPPRSGEIAQLNTNKFESETLPFWIGVLGEDAFGSISYHRSSLPAPPVTAWSVQISILLECAGSFAVTACVNRPSIVSRVSPPNWGA